MRFSNLIRSVFVGAALALVPAASFAAVFVSVTIAPPVLPGNAPTDLAGVMRILALGNTPATFARGPGIANFNMALFKTFQVRERVKAIFRAEAYNIFNHTNFNNMDVAMTFSCTAAPTGTTPTPAPLCTSALPVLAQTNNRFGAPTSARAPRIMQASIRINF